MEYETLLVEKEANTALIKLNRPPVREVRIPAPAENARQSYKKFTLREPVDFALVSVASVLTFNDGVCKDARIVLGAVAPEPVRARSAEKILKGRTIDEARALEAAKEALASANFL